jgi:hypothetical protein
MSTHPAAGSGQEVPDRNEREHHERGAYCDTEMGQPPPEMVSLDCLGDRVSPGKNGDPGVIKKSRQHDERCDHDDGYAVRRVISGWMGSALHVDLLFLAVRLRCLPAVYESYKESASGK